MMVVCVTDWGREMLDQVPASSPLLPRPWDDIVLQAFGVCDRMLFHA